MAPFPRNLFQVWYQGCDRVTKPAFVQNMEQWQRLNPTWKYKCVSKDELRQACASYSKECVAAFDKLGGIPGLMHAQIDLGRYALMYVHGGAYVDMDMYALRNIESNHQVRTFIGEYESGARAHVLGVSTTKAASWYPRTMNNAMMMASARNPLLKDYIDGVIERILGSQNIHTHAPMFVIEYTTGPIMFHHYFSPRASQITIFPPEIFEPCHLDKKCMITENTVSIHTFELSWLPQWINAVLRHHVVILAVIILFTAGYYLWKKHSMCS